MIENQYVPTELGTEKVGTLLKRYAIPAVIAMTASSLYNMVDAIFIGQGVGALAISGLAVTFPFMNLGAAFGTLVGVGGATLTSVLLGQRNYGMAKKVLGNVVVMSIIVSILFSVFSLVFIDPILYFFGASENTIKYARDYMTIILSGSIMSSLYFALNALLRSSGHPKKAMMATIFTVILNAVLDPIFIFSFGWGIRGAAIATVISQVVSLIWILTVFSKKEALLHFERGIFKLDKRIVKDSLSIGLAPFSMNFVSCFIVILINLQFRKYGGDLAIGAYGIVNRVSFVIVMVVMGLNQGMQPIAGYNYGAKLYDRVLKVLKLTMISATIITTIGFLISLFIPDLVVSAFTRDKELITLASRGLRIALMVFPIVGFQMVVSNFFQSLGLAKRAIFLSLSRQLLFLLPGLLILPPLMGVAGVWYSFPISDIIATVVSATMLINFSKKIKTKNNG